MSTKLKPCPFCGCKAVRLYQGEVICSNCKAYMPSVRAWNRRVEVDK